MKNPPQKLISVKTFCAQFGVGKTTAYLLLGSRDLEGVKVGGRTLITMSSVDSWLTNLPRFREKSQ